MPQERRFVLAMNRFVWMPGNAGRGRRDHQRRRSALHFDRVEKVRSTGIDRQAAETVLELPRHPLRAAPDLPATCCWILPAARHCGFR
jgi:hypothetical protein